MRYETIHNLQIPKIGFGTWRIGNDPAADERSRLALRSVLELGYTHFFDVISSSILSGPGEYR
jgi:aryl-alcohol dehydrogenase-like predicted oxidoreductase